MKRCTCWREVAMLAVHHTHAIVWADCRDCWVGELWGTAKIESDTHDSTKAGCCGEKTGNKTAKTDLNCYK